MSARQPKHDSGARERETPISEPSVSMRAPLPPPQSFGRYVLHAPIARGGMATIYIARLIGAEGFSRLVAAKRLHPHFTEDPDFVAMFHDEARIASKIHHPNVVPVLDVVLDGQEVIIVQEYVHGVPLDKLFKSALLSEETTIPIGVAVALIAGVLSGLHAAHETRDELDEPLHIVHRDVSPDNVIVSLDGVPRLLDFGIAKARSSVHVTREGFFKGKIAYMAPEQLRAEPVTPASDVYSVGVLLWELCAHRRLHVGKGEAELFNAVLNGTLSPLTKALEGTRPWIDDARWAAITRLEPVAARALAKNPAARFASAADMMSALVAAYPPATGTEVGHWVRALGADYLERRQTVLASSEESWRSHSKIAVAAGVDSGGPESLVKLVAQRDSFGRVVESTLPSPVAISAMRPPDAYAQSAQAPRANRMAWAITASLLVVVGILLGALAARTSDAPSAPAAAAGPVLENPAPSAAPVVMVAVPSAPLAADDVASPVAKPSRAAAPQAPAPPRWSPPAKPLPAPPPRAAAPPPLPALAPAAPSASSAKVDCDPPFYFEGTKKVYKPSCL